MTQDMRGSSYQRIQASINKLQNFILLKRQDVILNSFSNTLYLGQADKCPLGTAKARQVDGLERNEDSWACRCPLFFSGGLKYPIRYETEGFTARKVNPGFPRSSDVAEVLSDFVGAVSSSKPANSG